MEITEGGVSSVISGDRAFCVSEFEKALGFYSKALITGGINSDEEQQILRKRSHCYFELNNYKDSLADAIEMMKINPESTLGVLMSAKSLSKLKRYEEALNMYQKGFKLDPNDHTIIDGLSDTKHKISERSTKSKESKNLDYNALDLCSQEPYPGDKDQLQAEGKILEKWRLTKNYGDILNKTLSDADAQWIANLVEKGRNCKQNSELTKAIEYFNKVLEADPENIHILQEMAEIFYRLDDYKEAYSNCCRIPTDLRSYHVWKLGGKILRELELLVTAESWLKHATEVASKNEETEAALIFQQVRVKRIFGPYTKKLPVEVVFSEYGRSVEARSEINSKTLLFKETPVVLAQTIDSLDIPACSQCARCLMTAEQYFGKDILITNAKLQQVVTKYWPKRTQLHCKNCKYETYCSETCREAAWDGHHQIICPSVNKNAQKLYNFCTSYEKLEPGSSKYLEGVWNASFSPMILARIWASIICNSQQMAADRGDKSPTHEDVAKAKITYRRFIAFGQCSNAKQIPKMVEIMRSIFQRYSYEITEREFDGRYFQAACNIQAFSDSENPYKLFFNLIKSKPALRDLAPFVIHEPKEADFGGLFSIHACMNHSCYNNALVLDGEVEGKPGIRVSARRQIQPGEEICTTYINPKLSRQERQTALYRAYNFWCQCDRCKYEGDDSTSCTYCGKEAQSEKPFPACGKCRRAWYCSTKCQKTAWKKGHKKICCGV